VALQKTFGHYSNNRCDIKIHDQSLDLLIAMQVCAGRHCVYNCSLLETHHNHSQCSHAAHATGLCAMLCSIVFKLGITTIFLMCVSL
jgi:hypothetical protein